MSVDFDRVIEQVGRAVDGLGVAVTVAGLVAALVSFGARRLRTRGDRDELYRSVRRSIGRSILLGLELLVAADIIRTVAGSPTFESVGVLAAIVAIRSFLSFTLEMEISGRWPWQQQPERPGDRAV